jgi:hypothetical protein
MAVAGQLFLYFATLHKLKVLEMLSAQLVLVQVLFIRYVTQFRRGKGYRLLLHSTALSLAEDGRLSILFANTLL